MASHVLPRGIRNNNPGNLRLGATRWQGQKAFQFDPDFVEFETPEMGLRALMRVLLTYYRKYRLDTVESIINRFAPPHENATDGYIHHVARRLGVKRRAVIDLESPAVLLALAQGIVAHENGAAPKEKNGQWYAPDLFKKAYALILQKETT